MRFFKHLLFLSIGASLVSARVGQHEAKEDKEAVADEDEAYWKRFLLGDDISFSMDPTSAPTTSTFAQSFIDGAVVRESSEISDFTTLETEDGEQYEIEYDLTTVEGGLVSLASVADSVASVECSYEGESARVLLRFSETPPLTQSELDLMFPIGALLLVDRNVFGSCYLGILGELEDPLDGMTSGYLNITMVMPSGDGVVVSGPAMAFYSMFQSGFLNMTLVNEPNTDVFDRRKLATLQENRLESINNALVDQEFKFDVRALTVFPKISMFFSIFTGPLITITASFEYIIEVQATFFIKEAIDLCALLGAECKQRIFSIPLTGLPAIVLKSILGRLLLPPLELGARVDVNLVQMGSIRIQPSFGFEAKWMATTGRKAINYRFFVGGLGPSPFVNQPAQIGTPVFNVNRNVPAEASLAVQLSAFVGVEPALVVAVAGFLNSKASGTAGLGVVANAQFDPPFSPKAVGDGCQTCHSLEADVSLQSTDIQLTTKAGFRSFGNEFIFEDERSFTATQTMFPVGSFCLFEQPECPMPTSPPSPPTAPQAPVSPTAPQAPASPTAPAAPQAPASPTAPIAPVSPTAPIAPQAPSEPSPPSEPTAPPPSEPSPPSEPTAPPPSEPSPPSEPTAPPPSEPSPPSEPTAPPTQDVPTPDVPTPVVTDPPQAPFTSAPSPVPSSAPSAVPITNAGLEFWIGEPDNAFADDNCRGLFGISVANPSDIQANVVIIHPATNTNTTLTVPPDDLQSATFPCRGTFTARIVTAPVYHVVSDMEVVVWAFVPPENSQSNDASLILPENALGTNYHLLSYFDDEGDSFATFHVVATQDDTLIQVFVANGELLDAPTIQRGQMYQRGFNLEITGWNIVTNKPAAVFSGNRCASVGNSTQFCDILFEQLLPVKALASSYIFCPTLTRPIGCTGPENCSPDLFRIVSVEDGTNIEAQFPEGTVQTMLNKRAASQTLRAEPFIISADKPFYAFQLLISEQSGAPIPGTGDPSMIILIPQEQFLDEYLFLTPDTFAFDYVNFVTAVGTSLTLDGATVNEPCISAGTLEGTEYCCTSMAVSDGVHRVQGSQPFGLIVTGFDDDASYGYAGGAGLTGVNA